MPAIHAKTNWSFSLFSFSLFAVKIQKFVVLLENCIHMRICKTLRKLIVYSFNGWGRKKLEEDLKPPCSKHLKQFIFTARKTTPRKYSDELWFNAVIFCTFAVVPMLHRPCVTKIARWIPSIPHLCTKSKLQIFHSIQCWKLCTPSFL